MKQQEEEKQSFSFFYIKSAFLTNLKIYSIVYCIDIYRASFFFFFLGQFRFHVNLYFESYKEKNYISIPRYRRYFTQQ